MMSGVQAQRPDQGSAIEATPADVTSLRSDITARTHHQSDEWAAPNTSACLMKGFNRAR